MRIAELLFFLMVFFFTSCEKKSNLKHRGTKLMNAEIVSYDSIHFFADMLSGEGNFFIQDSTIIFADSYKGTLFAFGLEDGKPIYTRFSHGYGKNQLPDFMDAYPITNTKDSCFAIDTSLNLFIWNTHSSDLENCGMIDFMWKKNKSNDYDSPSIYNLMEFTDFDLKFTKLNDSICIIPIEIINRSLKKMDKERYTKGHIFGELNLNTMHIDKVTGKFPEIYKDKPTPYFEFFDYAFHKNKIFVSHAIDSLIYVYEYPDKFLYTFGFDPPKINRKYTIGVHQDFTVFQRDMRHVGITASLHYVPQTELIIRTCYLGRMNQDEVAMQVYDKDGNLVLEREMGSKFKFLGYWKGIYYGTNVVPTETKSGRTKITLYRFKIKEKK